MNSPKAQAQMTQASNQAPKQERALRTQEALLDTLERLLEVKPFAELTVSELAREAGLTTGAIYRRFADKNDVLRSAFQRFLDRTQMHDEEYPRGLSDKEVLERYLGGLLDFTLDNIHLMRAANAIDDMGAFDQMTEARAVSANWLAGRLTTSSLTDEELRKRCQFILRIATATYRDTFLSGRGAATSRDSYRRDREGDLRALVDDLTQLAWEHLALPD